MLSTVCNEERKKGGREKEKETERKEERNKNGGAFTSIIVHTINII